jgi:hypothetical protein
LTPRKSTEKTFFANATTRFELAPARIRFGYRAEEFGWEIQALTPSEDDGPFTGGGFDRYELRGGLGAMFTLSTPDRSFYGGFGFTQILSDYSVLVGGQPAISTTTSAPFTTVNFGARYAFNKNTRITFDYTFYHGDIHCNFCTPSPNLPAGYVSTDPDVRLSTYGLV